MQLVDLNPTRAENYPIENKQVIRNLETLNRGLPKYADISTEVYENKSPKKWGPESLQKLLKTQAL